MGSDAETGMSHVPRRPGWRYDLVRGESSGSCEASVYCDCVAPFVAAPFVAPSAADGEGSKDGSTKERRIRDGCCRSGFMLTATECGGLWQ